MVVRRLGWWVGGGLVALGVIAAGMLVRLAHTSIDAAWAARALSAHYQANVDMASFHATLWPLVRGEGTGLVLRDPRRPQAPPLVSATGFRFTGQWGGLLHHPPALSAVTLADLRITIPPHAARAAPAPSAPAAATGSAGAGRSLVVDRISADGAVLEIVSGNPAKPPRDFPFERLRLESAGLGRPMRIDATLENPKPSGLVAAHGQFGPWNAADPALTPLSGNYEFSHANLATLHGIGGTLSSQGKYTGVLGAIDVAGTTDTPDFYLAAAGGRIHLRTQFQATVDGESGDTRLEPVTARWNRTTAVARGAALRRQGGEDIELDVSVTPGRIEDVLRLALRSATPLMSGDMTMSAHLSLPPGETDILQRLSLNGDVAIAQAEFSDSQVEDRLNELSRRGLGEKDAPTGERALFDLRSRFRLEAAVMHFQSLSFGVPGARISLAGTYDLASEQMDLAGTLQLQARPSEMVGGVKSRLLRPLDPFLSGPNGGTQLPLRITGTRTHPEFKVDLRKALHW